VRAHGPSDKKSTEAKGVSLNLDPGASVAELAQKIVNIKAKFCSLIPRGDNAYHLPTFITNTDTMIKMTIDQAFPQGNVNIRFSVQTNQHTDFVQALVTALPGALLATRGNS
jgi:hypothetical protein